MSPDLSPSLASAKLDTKIRSWCFTMRLMYTHKRIKYTKKSMHAYAIMCKIICYFYRYLQLIT